MPALILVGQETALISPVFCPALGFLRLLLAAPGNRGSGPGLGEAGACSQQVLTDHLGCLEQGEVARMMTMTRGGPCAQGANRPRSTTLFQLRLLLVPFCQQLDSRGATRAPGVHDREPVLYQPARPSGTLSCLLSWGHKRGFYYNDSLRPLPATSGQNLGVRLLSPSRSLTFNVCLRPSPHLTSISHCTSRPTRNRTPCRALGGPILCPAPRGPRHSAFLCTASPGGRHHARLPLPCLCVLNHPGSSLPHLFF